VNKPTQLTAVKIRFSKSLQCAIVHSGGASSENSPGPSNWSW